MRVAKTREVFFQEVCYSLADVDVVECMLQGYSESISNKFIVVVMLLLEISYFRIFNFPEI